MEITALVRNRDGEHQVVLRTGDVEKTLVVPPKPTGRGSSASGGELLFLALATCYCNDIFREAGRRRIAVESVEVQVKGEFAGEGEPASRIEYSAKGLAPLPRPSSTT